MKKVTRFMSMVIAVIMLVSLVPMSVMADDKGVIDGLYVDYSAGGTVSYATDKVYNGSRSVKIETNGSGGIWMGDPVVDFKMDPKKAYGIEFYIYVDSWTSGRLWLRPTGSDNQNYPTVHWANLEHGGAGLYLNGTNKARWGIEKITEGEKAGWYRVWNKSAIYSEKQNFSSQDGRGKGYMWHVEENSSNFSIRLDNINIYEWTGYTTTENSGTRGENPIFVQDFEGEKLPQVEAPKKEELITNGINLTPNTNNVANGFYGITTARAYSGERSLYVDSTNGLVGLGSGDTDFDMVDDTPYGIKFSLYVEENVSGNIQLWPVNGAGNRWASVYYTTVSGTSATGLKLDGAAKGRWNVTEGTGDKAGWYTFESTYPIITDTASGGAFKPGNMFTFNGKFKAYLDNIEIYNWTKPAGLGDVTANGMGTTLLASNDFEKQYTLAKNLSATQISGTQISVSWRNPVDIPPTAIKLYDAESNVLIAENFDVTADAVVEYIDEDFVSGTEKNYRVDFIYADGSIKSQVAGILPTGSGYEYNVGNWKVVSTSPKMPIVMEVDDSEGKTSAPSIRISSNEPGYDAKNAILQLYTDATLDTNKTYRVSGWVKKNNVAYIYDRVLATSGNEPNRMYKICGTWNKYESTGWKEFTVDCSPSAANSPVLNFTFVGAVEDFWIDDVTLYEIDADGNPTGENLVDGIGSLDSIAEQAEAVGVEAISDVEKAIIRWNNDTETVAGAKYVAVYDNAMGMDIPVAYVPVSMGYVDIANLIPGATYSYTVKAVSADGRESENGIAVTATPKAVAMIIGEYETAKNGNDVTVSIDVKNNEAGNSVTAQLILAVYNGVTLSTITGTEVTAIPQTALGANPVTLSKTVTVPTGHRLVMYLWNSMEGMRPLKPSQEY